MTKKLILAAFVAAMTFTACHKEPPIEPTPTTEPVAGSEFGRALRSLDIVSRVDTIVPEQNPAEFAELYQVTFTQPVDHDNPAAGSFTQKAFLFYVGADRPTVLYTCGYTLYETFRQVPFIDIAYNMNANLLMVEHRYYGDSKPEGDPQWTYLTTRQAAADHHAIIDALKSLLPMEWVSTGTSKDGMTSLFLRYYYPNDITVTTAFCAPLMPSLHYLPVGRYLLEESGTAEERSRMEALMERLLEDGEQGLYARCLELLEDHGITHDYTYNWYPHDCFTYNWYVHDCLAFFFNFFSYQTPATRQLPSLSESDDQLLLTIFENTFAQVDYGFLYPYYVQTAKELGQFFYDYSVYANLLDGTAFDYDAAWANASELAPADRWLYDTYDNTFITDLRDNFLPSTTCPILLVYTKDDPWTGSRPASVNPQSAKLIINPDGIHRHDINNAEHYAPALRQEIMDFVALYVHYDNDPVVAKRPAFSFSPEMNDRFMINKH